MWKQIHADEEMNGYDRLNGLIALLILSILSGVLAFSFPANHPVTDVGRFAFVAFLLWFLAVLVFGSEKK